MAKKKSPKAASAATASKKGRKQKGRGNNNEAGAEENLDNLPDNVLLRIFIKAGYKGRLTAMQGALLFLQLVQALTRHCLLRYSPRHIMN